MKKSIIWIFATFLLVLVAGIVLYSLARPYEIETHEYEIKENFNDIKITTDTADIQFILSENPSTFIICEEEKNANHSVTVKENTLRIEIVDDQKWYEDIGIKLRTPKITVYLGKSEYSNISLETDTGNILLDNIITTGKLAIKTDTGNVKFEACDASEVIIKTETGNVTGSFLTDKVVFAESDTGKIDIPKVIADEKCEVITDTGNIKITIEQGNKNSSTNSNLSN